VVEAVALEVFYQEQDLALLLAQLIQLLWVLVD
jgi:hypothetical protein